MTTARAAATTLAAFLVAQMFAIVIEDTLYLKTDTPAAIDSSPRAARRSYTRAEAGASTRATGALRPHASMFRPR